MGKKKESISVEKLLTNPGALLKRIVPKYSSLRIVHQYLFPVTERKLTPDLYFDKTYSEKKEHQ